MELMDGGLGVEKHLRLYPIPSILSTSSKALTQVGNAMKGWLIGSSVTVAVPGLGHFMSSCSGLASSRPLGLNSLPPTSLTLKESTSNIRIAVQHFIDINNLEPIPFSTRP